LESTERESVEEILLSKLQLPGFGTGSELLQVWPLSVEYTTWMLVDALAGTAVARQYSRRGQHSGQGTLQVRCFRHDKTIPGFYLDR
jgi:hypothetical protein